MFFLTLKSIKSRALISSLSILSIAIGVFLLFAIERLRIGIKEGFSQTISKADFIVGAKGGELPLLLYTIFQIGRPTNNIRQSSISEFEKNDMVDWVIPLSLGDNYKGYRVVATDERFFQHYRYRQTEKIELAKGSIFSKLYDVVLGAHVASNLGLSLGNKLALTHGASIEGGYDHADTPFSVVGILKPTGTPIDQGVYICLEGMEAIHIGWESGVPDADVVDKSKLTRESIKVEQLTSAIIGLKARMMIFRFRDFVSNYSKEPLMAVIPGLALSDLWKITGNVEALMMLISLAVFAVAVVGMAISLFSSLHQRRREMAILRAVGASKYAILYTLVMESAIVTGLGIVCGLSLLFIFQFFGINYLEQHYNFYLSSYFFSIREVCFLIGMMGVSIAIALIPGFYAYRKYLHDGLIQ